MQRGEIWLINLDPTIGAEISKKRPALIIDDNGIGKLPLRVIAPITHWKPHYGLVPWMVRLPAGGTASLDKDSAVDCFQLRSLDERRMISRLGFIDADQMARVEACLRTVLRLG